MPTQSKLGGLIISDVSKPGAAHRDTPGLAWGLHVVDNHAQTTNLSAPVRWKDANTSVVQINDENRVAIKSMDQVFFYRLISL